MSNKPGIFISFEGGEGAGKTTLISKISEHLVSLGRSVISTREPGGTKAAEDIRHLVVTGDEARWDAISETALFLTARHTHVEQLIKPALVKGSIVLCDRFLDSTMVYQGIAKQLGVDYVSKLSALIVGDIAPDLTFLIDVDPETGLGRTKERVGAETRFEAHGLEFHRMIREGFKLLATKEPARITVVDGHQTEEQVFEETKAHIEHYLSKQHG